MSGYPIYLTQLHSSLCVVVGGGPVAERKVDSLLAAGAQVKIISPALSKGLAHLVAAGAVTYLPRPYQKGDLQGAFLVIAATGDSEVNRAVAREAGELQMLVNVVDVPSRSNFYVPAVVRRGALTLTVSTDGHSPALAAHIRRQLEASYGTEYAALLELLGELRGMVIDSHPPRERGEIWCRLIDSDLLELLRQDKYKEAREMALSLIRRPSENPIEKG